MSSRKRQARPKEGSRLAEAPLNENPFHILMTSDGTPLDESRLRLSRRMKRDYLSKRHRLIQMCKMPRDREAPTFWSGASPTEKSLLSCCELPKMHAKEEDYVVPGALARSKITKFIGLAAVECYELDSRALALAILERTWESDEEAKDLIEAYTENGEAIGVASPARKAKMNDGKAYSSIAKVGIKGKADRLLTFFAGGGLRILNQWLVDASTPVYAPPPKPPPGESGRPKRTQPSEMWKAPPTGDLLLPLLILLTYSPFDLDLVTESKINKQIRKLSKDADAIVLDAQQNPRKIKIETHTDPKVGGLVVKDVQKALNDLKEMWKSKQKETSDLTATDPFASIKAALAERLVEAKSFDKGDGEKPKWLVKAEEVSKKNSKAGSKKPQKRASVLELAKLERNKERQQLLKGDLQKASEERAILMNKIRQMNHKKTTEESRRSRSRKRKGVHWKDGHGAGSTTRNRDKLEEVHVIKKDESVTNSATEDELDDGDGLLDLTLL
uniref:Uncharacterized protein n=1 Tax=Entomoneis paludosa TaxID=265537 RepID=A0A7S2YSL1_9STRA|mmetsp:Transcript_8113/g.16925  ORF Transcript_8113/g.16925 Transcript_8113/m.16925 type:complete len:501 (+) Transcript_8113:111-1613(+)